MWGATSTASTPPSPPPVPRSKPACLWTNANAPPAKCAGNSSTIYAGPAQTSTQNHGEIAKSFREYIEQHRAEITALQILYSRPFKQRLTEPLLKELEKKLRDQHAAWTEDNLWNAFAAAKPGKVKGRSQAGRFADLVSLVRFALEQQPVLAPFADSVTERFNEWLMDKAKANREAGLQQFTDEQLAWLNLIRDHIATSISIERDDFEQTPFIQRGGLGKAHQLFGEQLPKLLDELNEQKYDDLKLKVFTRPKPKGYSYSFGAWVVIEDDCDADARKLQIISQYRNGEGKVLAA
jgi:EcoEI R protein C-terminal